MNRALLYKIFTYCLPVAFLTACAPSDQSEELKSYPAFGMCNIDTPGKNTTLDSMSDFHLGGWAFSQKDHNVPDAVIVYFVNEATGELVTRTATRAPREDVVAAFKQENLLNSGFDTVVAKNTLQPGRYRIELIQVSNRNGSFRCDGEPHKITVK